MTVIPTTGTAPLQPVETTSSASEDATSALASDFDTFLQLLTAQLRNQDPLEPVDSTQFVEQLASFSSVEQQIRTNTLLESVIDNLGAGANSLAEWVGHEVEAAAPLRFDGSTPLDLKTEPNPDAIAAVLVVRDEDGRVVARKPIDPAASTLSWDGTATDGETVDPGVYSFQIQRSDGEESLPAVTPLGFARVAEARLEDGEVNLILEGGSSLRADDVVALRDGQTG
ncbi:MAG: flagellar hook capping FlgD N-terminal domain-containing protein [Pseudomonadota bacterium]